MQKKKKKNTKSNCDVTATTPGANSCGADEWQCDNGKCINAEFLCDNTFDCTDNSDEGNICNRGKILLNV